MNNKGTLREKLWAKILGILILCVTGTVITASGAGLIWLADRGGFNAGTYYETDDIRSRANYLAYSALETFVNSPEDMTEVYGPDVQNAWITIEREIPGAAGTYERVWSNDKIGQAGYQNKIEQSYRFYEEDSRRHKWEFHSDVPVPVEAEDGETQDYVMEKFRVNVAVMDPITVDDWYFYDHYNIFNLIHPLQDRMFKWGVGMLAFFAAALVFMLNSAGHVSGVEGIRETVIDTIPYEILTFLCVVIIGICAALFATVLESPLLLKAETLPYAAGLMIVILMVSALFFLLFLMSTAVRLKAHHFWQNTLLSRCTGWLLKLWHRAADIVRALPVVPFTALTLAAWLGLCVFCAFNGMPEFVLVLNLVLAAAVLLAAYEMRTLEKGGQTLAGGITDIMIDTSRLFGPFRKHGDNLNSIGRGMELAVERQIRSERMKTELITNVSHDIKTPLTSIINYVDLLQKEHTPEQEKEYLEVLERQSQRLKKLTEDVVEASKASTGNMTVNLAPTNVREISDQALAEYKEKLDEQNLNLIMNMPDAPLYVLADGRLLWRVLRNLLGNIAKYAMPGSRVYFDVVKNGNSVDMIFKNTSRDELNISAEELMERFVRGDRSRHTEGSGLGLNIARSLTELMGGTMKLTVDGDLFKVTVSFPAVTDRDESWWLK